MEELKLKWGVALEKTHEAFLLGVNINIGKYNYKDYYERYGFLCVYLGYRTLVIGKDYFK